MLLRFDDSDPGMEPHPRRQVASTGFDIGAALGAMWRHKTIMLTTTAAALALGVIYITIMPQTYRAAIQVMIVDEVAGATGEFMRPSTLGQNEVMLESAQKVLESQTLALAVVQDLALHERSAFTAPEGSVISTTLRRARAITATWLPGAAGADDPVEIVPEDSQLRMAAADALREAIIVKREGRSSAFSIRYESTDPELAAAIVNSYGLAFVSDQLIGTVEASARVLDWLRDRLLVIQENSTEATLKVEDFRARNGLLTVSGETLTVQTISQLTSELATAIVELARARSLSRIYAELRKMDPVSFVESGAAGVRVPEGEISASEQRLLILLQRREAAEQQYGPDHVEVARLHTVIEAEGRALQREVQRIYESSLNAVRALEIQVGMLRASIAEMSAENVELAKARVALLGLERQAEIFDALNQTYLLRLKDLEQTQTFPVTNVRILSVAEAPEDQVAPRKSVILSVMLVLGAIVGGALSIRQSNRNRFIRSKSDLHQFSSQPFFGYLPSMPQSSMGRSTTHSPLAPRTESGDGPQQIFDHPFAALANARSEFTETLRNIRVVCDSASSNGQGFVLGLASVDAGEGKTTLAAGLAALVASSDSSVLLVDADMLSAGLSRMLGQSMGIGLREVLVGRVSWQDALRGESTTGLHFLPCNIALEYPMAAEVAAAPAFRIMISEARQHYDYIFIDLPPLGFAPDATDKLSVLDGVVIVLELGQTPKDRLRSVLSADPVLYEKFIGTVLNKTKPQARDGDSPVYRHRSV
jgi:succinoglycan biosynthesis transport protein ExoP